MPHYEDVSFYEWWSSEGPSKMTDEERAAAAAANQRKDDRREAVKSILMSMSTPPGEVVKFNSVSDCWRVVREMRSSLGRKAVYVSHNDRYFCVNGSASVDIGAVVVIANAIISEGVRENTELASILVGESDGARHYGLLVYHEVRKRREIKSVFLVRRFEKGTDLDLTFAMGCLAAGCPYLGETYRFFAPPAGHPLRDAFD